MKSKLLKTTKNNEKIGKRRGESNGEVIIHKFKSSQNIHQVVF